MKKWLSTKTFARNSFTYIREFPKKRYPFDYRNIAQLFSLFSRKEWFSTDLGHQIGIRVNMDVMKACLD